MQITSQTMQITAQGLMGIQKATLNLEPGKVVEVAGPNASGKTSLATICQALFTQTANPLGVPAPERKNWYLRDGEGEGEGTLLIQTGDGDGEIIWRPAAGTVESPLKAGLCHPESVGVVDFTARRGPKERAGLLHDILLPSPDVIMSQLGDELKDVFGIREAPGVEADRKNGTDLEGVIRLINTKGWKAAEEVYAERARHLKRQWSDITGRNHGVRIAADWLPDDWLAEYDGLTVSEMETEIARQRDALNTLHRVDAVTEQEIADLEHLASQVDSLQEDLTDARRSLQDNDADAAPILQLQSERQADRRAILARKGDLQEVKHLTCPHCGGAVILNAAGELEIFDPDRAEEDLQKQRDDLHGQQVACEKELADLQTRLDRIHGQRDETSRARTIIENELEKAAAARKRLAGVAVDDGEQRQRQIAEAEEEIEKSRKIIDLIKARKTTQEQHASIQQYTRIAGALGTNGVRGKMLTKKLGILNAGLKAVAQVTGWPTITVTAKGDIAYGDRPAPLCSESEQWRIQAALQLTIAAMTKDPVVVLDRGDLLDAANREALKKVLPRVAAGKQPLAVLLCSTEAPEYDGWTQHTIQEGVLETA